MTEIANRRRNLRFPLRLGVTCRWTGPVTHAGRIVVSESMNISSKSLVLATTEPFQPGQVLEASIDWPVLLDQRVNLSLIVEGKVIRAGVDHAVVEIEKYWFKTRGAR